MRLIFLVFGVGFLMLSIFLIKPIYEKEKDATRVIVQNKDTIKHMQKRNDALVGIQEAALLKSSQYYAMFMSRLNHDANTMAFKVKLEIVERKASTKKLISEDYPGINQILFTLTFQSVTDGVERVRILKQLQQWQEDYPLHFSSIECTSMQCQITGGMYGL